jgi:hypothetical protein
MAITMLFVGNSGTRRSQPWGELSIIWRQPLVEAARLIDPFCRSARVVFESLNKIDRWEKVEATLVGPTKGRNERPGEEDKTTNPAVPPGSR